MSEQSSTHASAASHYRPEIDGLRAVAVLSVMLFHAGNGAFPGGYVGVDVFFVISGFLITSIISKEVERGSFSFAHFYERRIRRIFPALYFLLLVVTLAGLAFLTPPELRDLGQSVFATVAFAGNIFFYFKSGYFDPDGETQPLLHMWSLGVEEQFYIFFPVFLLVVSRRARKWLIPLLVAILMVSLAASVAKIESHPSGVFYLPHYRAWELLVGCILAFWMRKGPRPLRDKRLATAGLEAIGLACIIVPVLLYSSDTMFPGFSAIPPVIGTAILIAVSHPGSPIGRLLSWRPMVLVGLISYSAYLWHQPLLVFARLRTGFSLEVWQANLLCLAALALAYFSWRYVERPFRDRDFLTRSRLFLLAALASAIVAGAGLALHFGKGLPQRFSQDALMLAESAQLSPKRTDCHADASNPLTFDTACRYGGEDVSWAILGDSHGIELGYALSEALAQQGKGLLHLTYSGCAPLVRAEVENPGCTSWLKATADALAADDDIENIVVAFRHSQYLSGPIHKPLGAPDQFHPPFLRELEANEAIAAYWEDFERLIAGLAAGGRRVFLVITVPELQRDPMDYVFTGRWPFLAQGRSDIPLALVEKRQAEVRRMLSRIVDRTPGLILIDPNRALCRSGGCAVIEDRSVLYFDDNHVSVEGARRIVSVELSSYLAAGAADQ